MNIENEIHNENLTLKPIPAKILYCKTCKSNFKYIIFKNECRIL